MRGFGPWYSETWLIQSPLGQVKMARLDRWLHYMSGEIDCMSLLYDYTRNAYSKLCDYAEIL